MMETLAFIAILGAALMLATYVAQRMESAAYRRMQDKCHRDVVRWKQQRRLTAEDIVARAEARRRNGDKP